MFSLCLLAMASNCNLHHQNIVLTNETRTQYIILWSLCRLMICKSASIVTRLWTGWRVWCLTGAEIFLFATTSRSALGLTQPSIQWLLGALSLGVKQLKHESGHVHISLRLRMHGSMPQFSHVYLIKHKTASLFFTFSAMRHVDQWNFIFSEVPYFASL
jgi:hypothetical protein